MLRLQEHPDDSQADQDQQMPLPVCVDHGVSYGMCEWRGATEGRGHEAPGGRRGGPEGAVGSPVVLQQLGINEQCLKILGGVQGPREDYNNRHQRLVTRKKSWFV